jgi:hypothetical protein
MLPRILWDLDSLHVAAASAAVGFEPGHSSEFWGDSDKLHRTAALPAVKLRRVAVILHGQHHARLRAGRYDPSQIGT